MLRQILAALVLVVGAAAPAVAQPTIFLVRHAERADAGSAAAGMMASDPDLSAAGRLRAESLVKLLKDSRITAILTTEYKRTRQTAAPLGVALGVNPTVIPSKDAAGLAERLMSSTGNVLVVGHSNTIPEILKALGVADPITIDEQEYDNLFIVVRGALVRLRY
jgi:broad specificity phosphatase PhoE